MANKRTVDPSEFTDYIGARELRANALRKANKYDSYANQTEFDVIVLSQPIPLATKNVKPKFFSGERANISSTTEVTWLNDESFGAYQFKGRILGSDFISPHETLPNPCDLAINADPGLAAKILKLHTTFISSENQVRVPSVGETVRVVLTPGEHKFNLQYAYFDKLLTAADATQQLTILQRDCTSLEVLFDSFDTSQLSDLDHFLWDEGAGDVIKATPHFDPIIPADELSQLPTKDVGSISSRFQLLRPAISGLYSEAKTHPGIDIAAPEGTPIYPAIGHGKVTHVLSTCHNAECITTNESGKCTEYNLTKESKGRRCGGGFGNYVRIKHTLPDGSIINTAYNHLKNGSIAVKVGDTVGMNTKIAAVGNTGSSTGPHLHFEVFDGSYTARRNTPKPPKPGKNHVDPIQGLRLKV